MKTLGNRKTKTRKSPNLKNFCQKLKIPTNFYNFNAQVFILTKNQQFSLTWDWSGVEVADGGPVGRSGEGLSVLTVREERARRRALTANRWSRRWTIRSTESSRSRFSSLSWCKDDSKEATENGRRNTVLKVAKIRRMIRTYKLDKKVWSG